jgi:hypothetical protein
MGLFDRWRRDKKKERPKTTVRHSGVYKPTGTSGTDAAVEKKPVEELGVVEAGEVENLLAQAQSLIERREELQVERTALLKKLDNAELTATEFRKELMAKIQEGAQVSEDLRRISSRLTQLGHPSLVI